MKEKTIIFKASEAFVQFLESEAKKRNMSKSALIRECVKKTLEFDELQVNEAKG